MYPCVTFSYKVKGLVYPVSYLVAKKGVSEKCRGRNHIQSISSTNTRNTRKVLDLMAAQGPNKTAGFIGPFDAVMRDGSEWASVWVRA